MIAELIGIAALLFGLFFCIVGVVGIIRMPDLYSRLHAAGKVAILGVFGFLIGGAILMPEITLKALALGIFLLITAPVTTHAIAASEYRRRDIAENIANSHGESMDGKRTTSVLGQLTPKDLQSNEASNNPSAS